MPPKRKLANSGGPTSKRRANNEATPLEEANTAAMGQDPPQPLSSRSQAPIDYDLLAAAIIKQSQQPQSGTVTIEEPLQSPSNTTDHQPKFKVDKISETFESYILFALKKHNL